MGPIIYRMKILHIGGFKSLTHSLIEYQRSMGLSSEKLNFPESEYLFLEKSIKIPHLLIDEICRSEYSIIHLHSKDSLRFNDAGLFSNHAELSEQIIKLKNSGCKVIFSSFDQEPAASSLVLFDHIFVSSAEGYSEANKNSSWSWVPIWTDLNIVPKPPVEDPDLPLKFIHIKPAANNFGTELIQSAFDKINEKRHRCELKIVNENEILSLKTLYDILHPFDVFLEYIGRESYGIFAVEAMAMGKTVISSNTPYAKDANSMFALSPVLNADPSNIQTRIEKVLGEPKCCRDFGKRSRAFVERAHSLEIIGRIITDTYQKLINS